ncbi:MAG: hypothetical protein WCY48_07495 [Candidatus Caldatribacteriota bacterium]
MRHECAICGATDEVEDFKSFSKERIYKKYRYHEFWLCYKHSVEFFKLGQEVFMQKYESVTQEKGWASDGESSKTSFYF